MSDLITLTAIEIRQALLTGGERIVTVIENKLPPTHRLADEWPYRRWGTDIEGAAAELAFAKARGHYYDSYVGVNYARQAGDVGRTQVRSTWHDHGCLTVYNSDPDDAPFVLMVGMIPTFRIAGWLYGREAKQPRWWQPHLRKPAFFVPQQALRRVDARPAQAAA
jgi:hypothetical protein